ncbi:acyloxyacyl hydrolase [Lutibacter sp.]
MKQVLFLFLFCSSLNLFSQQFIERNLSFQSDVFFGQLIEHDKSLKTAIQKNSFGLLLSWNTVNTKENRFNTLYNYPERGYSFLYENFNSTVLGEAYGLYRHYTYQIGNQNNHFKLTTAFGLAYASKPYDKVSNPYNFALGSHALASAFLKFQYYTLFQKQHIQLNTAVSLIHFSNISFKNPNLGINTVAFHVGINYLIRPKTIQISDKKNNIDTPQSAVRYALIFRTGINESKEINSGRYPFFTASFYAYKKMNAYSVLTGGIDFFNSLFLKHYIQNINDLEGTNYNTSNFQRVGLFVGHELTQNHFAFISQIGYTVYYPFPYVSRVYERFGFKHQLSQHLFSELTMKVNLFRAEALEFGLGYTF